MGAFSDLRLSFRRIVLLTALLAAAVFATGAGAQATTTTHTPTGFAGMNPCTAEAFSGQGFLHTQSQTNDGLTHTEMNLQDVKAVSVTGAKYVATNQSSATVNNMGPGSRENMELISHLIRQKEVDGVLVLDPGDDFTVRTRLVLVVNANGVVTVEDIDFTTMTCQ